MAEYIEKTQLLEKLKHRVSTDDDSKFATGFIKGTNEALSIIEEWIESIPAADVAPVVHAHWYMRGGRACCSNCDVKSLWKSDWDGCKNHEREFVSAKSNYCPHCGAKMDGEEHNNV